MDGRPPDRPLPAAEADAIWEALRVMHDRLEDVADAARLQGEALQRQIVLTKRAKDERDRGVMLRQLDEARALLSADGDDDAKDDAG